MSWWTITYLHNDRAQTSLHVLAATNRPDHLFMEWATWKPARRPIYRTVRGKRVFCGWKYIWDTPNLVEQSQTGDTHEHIFITTPLLPSDHVWYYLFSAGEPPTPYCQSALIHVFPPEIEMASAHIFNSVDQPCVNSAPTIVHFDSVLYDDYHFYDPAAPDRFTIPAGALYTFGANVALGIAASGKCHLSILLNGAPPILRHDHLIEDTGWAGATITLHTQRALHPGDFLQVQVLYTGVGARDIKAYTAYSPYFWIRLVGAYPI